ncbi:MAG: division/cell wall cluster transcriptional repressor MraZ [Clostridiales Family XIII bacterium]|jgi:MraZ protein|nr:division/cell wall cluster transcriptional repressor MraZ [Clostridiales Family XIII bacterium]
MLTGSYINSIDSKGRAVVPAKLRYGLAERIWLVKGIDPCLYLFAPEAWTRFKAENLDGNPFDDPNARQLKRRFLTSSREIEIDGHGRILIPAEYLAYAGIEKDVVFAGMEDMVELWSGERFAQVMDDGGEDASALLAAAAGFRRRTSGQPDGGKD